MRLKNDQVCSAVWFAFGMVSALASFRYKLGSFASPGTGFMPFLAGLAICFFSFISLVEATLKKEQGKGWKPVMEGLMWKKALIVLTALFAYALLLTYLGFLICTVLFIGFLLRVVKPQGWSVVLAGSILTALVAYGIFEIWLKAQLPTGPWGF